MDKPDNDIALESLDGRWRWQGQAAILNSIRQDRVLVFCLSEILSSELYTEFEADSCVEILEPDEFLRRCNTRVSCQRRFAESGLVHGRVEYYAPNTRARRSVKDPQCIPFFKHERFSHQHEYRVVVALRGGTQRVTRIVTGGFSFQKEISEGNPDHRKVAVGGIEDITRVHKM